MNPGWFLGPKAENAAVERDILLRILEDYFRFRRDCYPHDPPVINDAMRAEGSDFHARLGATVETMLDGLRRDFPFASPRYIAHMLSDQTMPAVLGYFAGLLYNANNVTPEAAPVTAGWELEFGAEMLRMLGFTPPPADSRPTANEFGWAHITNGGTVANLEALWAARNVRYFPLAAADVCRKHSIEIVGCPLDDPFRIAPNDAIYLYPRLVDAVHQHYCLARSEAVRVTQQLLSESPYSIPHHGTAAAYGVRAPVLLVSGARHYSITKTADLLGIGRNNVSLVDVDPCFRMDARDLESRLLRVTKSGALPLAVIGIAGTTEEGAVDPIHRIARLRDSFHFWLHIDAAWGGYLRTIFTPGCDIEDVRAFVSRDGLTWGDPEVCDAFSAFPLADSVTVDPHKLGYIPYPCGVAAYRNDLVRQFLNQEIPYLFDTRFDDQDARTHRAPASVGPYILEGSKPGSSVAACWLSHRLIPADRSGYGQILRASLLAARDFYERMISSAAADYSLIPIASQTPDTNVVCFFVKSELHPDLAFTNALNRRIFESFNPSSAENLPPFFLSRTVFEPSSYSSSAIRALLERARFDPNDYRLHGLFVLRATLMTPYLNMAVEAGKPNLLGEFFLQLDENTRRALRELGEPTHRSPVSHTKQSAFILDR
jgi:glutamate/tyrosine decarboxylase-like PLP-dependent enzyme